jgi:hypothetical protein
VIIPDTILSSPLRGEGRVRGKLKAKEIFTFRLDSRRRRRY